jgi:phosphate starvation-inducible PhoH-like protein
LSGRASSGRPARRLVAIDSKDLERAVCGPVHSHLQELEAAFADEGLRAESQGGGVQLSGEEEGVRRAAQALEAFMARIRAGAEATLAELQAAIALSRTSTPGGLGGETIGGLRRPVMAQTPGQRAYLETLKEESAGLVFGIGPAGTGKTFLAVAMGAAALRAGRFERLVVARPAVEAGERLGFLPGALEEKVDPYMLPIWDSLNECLGPAEVDRRKERKEIEVAPLAFMRGRTLKNAYVVIDEAQNATIPQMKMVLTRLGRGARMVVTGDPSQTDLPERTPSGLAHALEILKDVRGVAIQHLTTADVVRHELVGLIIEAYDRHSVNRS